MNQNLVNKSCGNTVKLIRNVFEQLSLKNNQIKTFDAITDETVDDIFTEIQLDNDLNKKETAVALKAKPLLKGFLDYCCKQRTSYFSVKNAVIQNVQLASQKDCTTCQTLSPMRQMKATIKHFKLYMLPKLLRSSYHQKTTANKEHSITFQPDKQHASNKKLIIVCVYCKKPRVMSKEQRI